IQAIKAFQDAEKLAVDMAGTGVHWCRLFLNKAKIYHRVDESGPPMTELMIAAEAILEEGDKLERESVRKILKTVGVNR
ncbi:hypothetical protein ACFLQV_05070, partial [Calditrichota bacterium]